MADKIKGFKTILKLLPTAYKAAKKVVRRAEDFKVVRKLEDFISPA